MGANNGPWLLDRLDEILDAGCGEGFLSRLVAERGAFVTAVDYSARLLEIARERTVNDLQIEYLHANLEHLDTLNDDTFDIVVSCVVIQDVPDYQAAVKEIYRRIRDSFDSKFRQQSYRLPSDANQLLQNDHWHRVYDRRYDGALSLSRGNWETSRFHR